MKETKYNLNDLIAQTERGLEINTIEKMLKEAYGIPPSTFRQHRAIKIDDTRTIKESDLAKYAAFFNTTVDKLRNYKIETGKSLKQLKSQSQRQEREMLKEELGLKNK